MTCTEAIPTLIEQVFGELEAELGLALHEHVASCPSCQAEERRLLALREGLRGPEVSPSAELRERLRAALAPAPPARARALLARPIPAYVALAAALAGALLALAATRGDSLTPRAPGLSLPVSSPLPGDGTRLFTSAGCYTTGVAARSRLSLVDSAGGTGMAQDSL